MKMSTLSIVFVVSLVIFTSFISSGFKYEGDLLLEIFIDDLHQLSHFNQILTDFPTQVSRWRAPAQNGAGSHVHVSRAVIGPFISQIRQRNLTYRTLVDNVQRMVDAEAHSNRIGGVPLPWMTSDDDVTYRKRRGAKHRRQTKLDSIVGRYANFSEISAWLYGLEAQFPNIVSVSSIGTTYEGRDLLLVKIHFDDGPVIKPGFWLDAGTHAREWISPSSAIYIIYRILSAYYSSTTELATIRSVDWYILPVLNPDGYAFTFDPNGNRFWRKNRSQYGVNGSLSYSSYYNMTCHGTDNNRNYPFNWNTVDTATDPCIETYGGPSENCELENQAVTSYLLANNNTIRGFMTLHSYGQFFFTRWSYSAAAKPPPEFNYTLAVTEEAVQAINATNGVRYQAGIAPDLMYAFSGGAGDWTRAMAGIKHAYEIELRDTGILGFVLPANYVLPVGEEIWAGAKVVLTHVIQDYP